MAKPQQQKQILLIWPTVSYSAKGLIFTISLCHFLVLVHLTIYLLNMFTTLHRDTFGRTMGRKIGFFSEGLAGGPGYITPAVSGTNEMPAQPMPSQGEMKRLHSPCHLEAWREEWMQREGYITPAVSGCAKQRKTGK